MSSKKYPRIADFSDIGLRIRKIRGSLSQTSFAKLFGVNQNTVSRWEKGQVLSDEETLKKIAAYGKVSLDYLLHGNMAVAKPQPLPVKPTSLDGAARPYLTSPNFLSTEALTKSIQLARNFLEMESIALSTQGEAELIAYIYRYLDSEKKDPGEEILRHVAKLIERYEEG